jgi:hypothetical protein
MLGHFSKAGVSPKRIVKEFEVTEDALLPVGMLPIFRIDKVLNFSAEIQQAPLSLLVILYLGNLWM